MAIKTVWWIICYLFWSSYYGFSQNIVLVMVDDLRPALGCYGDKNAFTPNIDALAEEGITFYRAYSQQALCAPSRNSLLTSRRPDTLHLYDFYNYWRETAGNFTTLPQYFKENGYITKSIGKIFHPGLSSNFSDDQPYSWSETPYHPPTEIYKQSPVCWNVTSGYRKNIICPVNPRRQPGGTLPDLQSLSVAQEFLKDINVSSKPFLLAVGFHKPHIPLKYPKCYLAFHPIENVTLSPNQHPSYGMPDVAWNPWTDLRERDDIGGLNLKFPYETIGGTSDWAKRIKQSYYAAVSYIDDLIGQLVKTIDEEGLTNNTSIVLIGDHGWSLGEHGEWSKYSNFDVAVRVPFIIRTPETRRTKHVEKSDHLVELVDLFPTLVDLSELKPLPQCPFDSKNNILCTEGTSLLPLIKAVLKNTSMDNWKAGAFSQYPRPGLYPTWQPNSDKPKLKNIKIMGYTIRTSNYRYTEWVKFESLAPDWETVYAVELYDHRMDRNENLNLADRTVLKNVKIYLSKMLRAGWRESLPK